jgi:FkbM family methyltransferase
MLPRWIRFAIGTELARRGYVRAFRPYIIRTSVGGIDLQCRIADQTGREWYDSDKHDENPENAETARLVRPGDRVLEVGARHGFVSVLMSKMVSDKGFVLGVEASPFNAMVAASQAGLNRLSNCHILHAAASDHAGTVRISRDSNSRVSDSADSIEVQALTVDDLDTVYGPFDVLKIDVEGFERQVLEGARNMLARHPRIMLEIHTPVPAFGATIRRDLGADWIRVYGHHDSPRPSRSCTGISTGGGCRNRRG